MIVDWEAARLQLLTIVRTALDGHESGDVSDVVGRIAGMRSALDAAMVALGREPKPVAGWSLETAPADSLAQQLGSLSVWRRDPDGLWYRPGSDVGCTSGELATMGMRLTHVPVDATPAPSPWEACPHDGGDNGRCHGRGAPIVMTLFESAYLPDEVFDKALRKALASEPSWRLHSDEATNIEYVRRLFDEIARGAEPYANRPTSDFPTPRPAAKPLAMPELVDTPDRAVAESPEGSVWLRLPSPAQPALPWVLVRAGLDVDEAEGRAINWSHGSLAEKDAVVTSIPAAKRQAAETPADDSDAGRTTANAHAAIGLVTMLNAAIPGGVDVTITASTYTPYLTVHGSGGEATEISRLAVVRAAARLGGKVVARQRTAEKLTVTVTLDIDGRPAEVMLTCEPQIDVEARAWLAELGVEVRS